MFRGYLFGTEATTAKTRKEAQSPCSYEKSSGESKEAWFERDKDHQLSKSNHIMPEYNWQLVLVMAKKQMKQQPWQSLDLSSNDGGKDS